MEEHVSEFSNSKEKMLEQSIKGEYWIDKIWENCDWLWFVRAKHEKAEAHYLHLRTISTITESWVFPCS